jgi:hypothetical protein
MVSIHDYRYPPIDYRYPSIASNDVFGSSMGIDTRLSMLIECVEGTPTGGARSPLRSPLRHASPRAPAFSARARRRERGQDCFGLGWGGFPRDDARAARGDADSSRREFRDRREFVADDRRPVLAQMRHRRGTTRTHRVRASRPVVRGTTPSDFRGGRFRGDFGMRDERDRSRRPLHAPRGRPRDAPARLEVCHDVPDLFRPDSRRTMTGEERGGGDG